MCTSHTYENIILITNFLTYYCMCLVVGLGLDLVFGGAFTIICCHSHLSITQCCGPTAQIKTSSGTVLIGCVTTPS